MKRILFPTYRRPVGPGAFLNRYKLSHPMSIVKANGVWKAVVSPTQRDLVNAQKYYIGGYTYLLTDAEAADLPPEWVENI